MRFFTLRGKYFLTLAAIFATLFGFGAPAFAQEMEKPGVAVYVVDGLPDNERKVFGSYLLAAIVNNGQGAGADSADAFLAAAMGEERKAQDGKLSKGRVCELGRRFNIRYLCVVSVSPAFDFFAISANMVDTETEKAVLKGEAQSRLKTMEDLTQASNKIVESMFGVTIPDANTKPESQQAPPQSAGDGAAAGAPPTVVSVAGEIKDVVDRVVAAVNAFKDATNKSIEAANAVKTATQSRNFSAIKDAKNKVESATAAVKKAKEDVTAAIDALNSSGPEAGAAVKAMGIDLSMFAGSAGDGGDGGEEGEGGGGASFYFTPRYQLPVGTPVSWGGVNAEIGLIWRNGVFFGFDLNYGMDFGKNFDDVFHGGDGFAVMAGGGFSSGKEFDLGNQMCLVIGGTVGFWIVDEVDEVEDWNSYGDYSGYSETYRSFNFIAPFVKWRWHSIEIMYRGLLGTFYIETYYDWNGPHFGYNNHQLMVGYSFGGRKAK